MFIFQTKAFHAMELCFFNQVRMCRNYSAPPNKPTQRISKRVAFGEKSHKSVQNHPNLC